MTSTQKLAAWKTLLHLRFNYLSYSTFTLGAHQIVNHQFWWGIASIAAAIAALLDPAGKPDPGAR